MARPPKPADERRSDVLQLRFTPPERATLEGAAAASGVLLSEFIRDSALEAAAKVKTRRKKQANQSFKRTTGAALATHLRLLRPVAG